MDVSKMKTLTTSKECTGKVNDEDLYLAWPRMELNRHLQQKCDRDIFSHQIQIYFIL